jgi:hypothetical protein
MSGSLIPNGKQQYFDANGTPLAGGKVYYYIPYTTTPKNTWQDINLSILNTNPIILDAAGECIAWGAGAYRQQVYDVNNNLIWDQYTYGINPAGSNFVSQEEVQTATQGQTIFTLTTITYTPGINSLVVFVNGSKQLVNVNYTETSSSVVTFASGLNASDVVDFYASLPATAQNMSNAVTVAYYPPFTNSVATNVQAKLAQTVSVKDFGAVGDGVTDDTTAIQTALNNNSYVVFPPGQYAVTSITFSTNGQQVDFNNAYLKGIASTSTVAVARFTALQANYNNLRINANYNTNYSAAIQIYSSSSVSYAGRCTWRQLGVYNAIIGVMIGTLTSSVPINNAVSENTIIGGEFRDVEICFNCYQPNGFMHVIGMTIDCQKYDWDSYHSGTFSYLYSCGVQNLLGQMMFEDCEFVKAQTALGYTIINGISPTKGTWTTSTSYAVGDTVQGPTGYQDQNYYCLVANTSGTFSTDLATGKWMQSAATIMITGCNTESSCTNFFGYNGSRYLIDGFQNNYWNNATSAFIEVANNTYGVFDATSLSFYKSAYAPDIGLINTHGATGWIFKFTNSVFQNQNIPTIFHGDYGYSTQSDVKFKNCLTIDSTYGYVTLDSSPTTLQPGLLILPASGVGSAPPSINYQTTVGGTSILIQTDTAGSPTLPDTKLSFTQCIDMISGAGQNILYTFPSTGPNGNYPTTHMIFEWWQKTIASTGSFNGYITVFYYDSSISGFLGSYTLADGTTSGGYVGNLVYGNTAGTNWVKNQMIIPMSYPNANMIGIRFIQNASAQRWKIGGIRLY